MFTSFPGLRQPQGHGSLLWEADRGVSVHANSFVKYQSIANRFFLIFFVVIVEILLLNF